MSRKLEKILEDNRRVIIIKITRELKNSGSEHFGKMDSKEIKERVQKLYQSLMDAVIEKNFMVFIDYVEDLTLKRIEEGFGLKEIQLSLTSLEKNVWKIIVDESSINDVIKYLGIITNIIGEGKDHIARIFLEQKKKMENLILDLKKDHKKLFEDLDLANILA